jgi:hypothetical protein
MISIINIIYRVESLPAPDSSKSSPWSNDRANKCVSYCTGRIDEHESGMSGTHGLPSDIDPIACRLNIRRTYNAGVHIDVVIWSLCSSPTEEGE